MPQVPVLNDNQVELNPLSGQRFDAPDIGAGGRMIGQALQSFGGDVQQVAQDWDAINAIHDEADAKALDNQYAEYTRDRLYGENGFYNTQNAATIDAAPVVEQDLAKKRAELLAAAKTKRSRAMLETVLGRRGEEDANGIARFTLEQVKSNANLVSEGRINNSFDDYAIYSGSDDPEAQRKAGLAKGTAMSEFASLAQRNGWRGPVLEDKRLQFTTDMHERVVSTLMLRDPVKAKAYLDANRGEIDSKAELDLDNKLEPLLVDADATAVADMMQGELTTSVGEAAAPDAPADAEPRAIRVANYAARPNPGLHRAAAFPASYKDPRYDVADRKYEAKYGLPAGLLSSIRLDGERSNANQVSSKGARGPYQFIASTRRGFMANYGIDPWRSPEEQVEAAAIHLRDDYKKYGSWDKAVAAYNGGHRGATNPVAETRNYVARVNEGMRRRGQSISDAPTAAAVAREDMGRQMSEGEAYIREKYASLGPRQVQLRVDAYKAEVRRRHVEAEQEKRAADDALWDAAQDAVADLGGWDSVTSTSQVPGFNEMSGARRNQVLNVVHANLKASERAQENKVKTNWEYYTRLLNMTPAELAREPVDRMRDNLATEEFKEMSKKRAKPDEGKAVTYNGILAASAPLLAGAGLSLTGLKGKDKDRVTAQRSEFLSDMSSWANNYHRTKGKWPDDKALQDKADLLMIEAVWTVDG